MTAPALKVWLECSLGGTIGMHCNNHRTCSLKQASFIALLLRLGLVGFSRVTRVSRVKLGLGLALGLGLV